MYEHTARLYEFTCEPARCICDSRSGTAFLRALLSFTRSRFRHGRWNTTDQQQGCDESICQEQYCKAQQLRQYKSSPDLQRQRTRWLNQHMRMGRARTTVASGTRGKIRAAGQDSETPAHAPVRFYFSSDEGQAPTPPPGWKDRYSSSLQKTAQTTIVRGVAKMQVKAQFRLLHSRPGMHGPQVQQRQRQRTRSRCSAGTRGQTGARRCNLPNSARNASHCPHKAEQEATSHHRKKEKPCPITVASIACHEAHATRAVRTRNKGDQR